MATDAAQLVMAAQATGAAADQLAASLAPAAAAAAAQLNTGEHFIHAVLVAAVLSPASYAFGQAARRLRLPQITGYLASGIVCGPYGLRILSEDGVSSLSVIEGACLGVIGLAAGAELHLSELSRSKRAVVSITVSICLATWAFCYVALAWTAPVLPTAAMLAGASARAGAAGALAAQAAEAAGAAGLGVPGGRAAIEAAAAAAAGLPAGAGAVANAAVAQDAVQRRLCVAVASLGATLMMARSPASAIAVLKEMDGKGTFCALVMGVVVLKDVLVIVAFALNIQIIPLILGATPAGGPSGATASALFTTPLLSLAASVSTGLLGGYCMSLALEHQLPRRAAAAARRLVPPLGGSGGSGLRALGGGGGGGGGSGGHAHGGGGGGGGGAEAHSRERMVLVLVCAAGIFQVARWMDAEPLLACVTAGTLAANRRYDRDTPNDVNHLIECVMYWTNVAFFGLAGASLKLTALAGTFWVALLVVVVRLAAIAAGSWAGCRVGLVRAEHRRLFWMSQITQAGVALGLSRIAGTAFPDWGGSFQALMTGIICMNMALGPPAFRFALIKVGEARAMGLPLLKGGSQELSAAPSPPSGPPASAAAAARRKRASDSGSDGGPERDRDGGGAARTPAHAHAAHARGAATQPGHARAAAAVAAGGAGGGGGEWAGVDESAPTTSLQLRMADGSRLVARFNSSHTVADVRRFVRASRPDLAAQPYAFASGGFPPRPVTDEAATLESLGLLNAVLVQRRA